MEARTAFDFTGLFDAVGELATASFGFGGQYVTAQANQAIAQTYANAGLLPGVQNTQPVIMMGNGNPAPAQQQAQRSGINPWLIGGIVLAVVAVAGYFFWKSKK